MAILSLLHAYTIPATLAAVASVAFFKFIIYPLFLSPLSKIPAAHPLAHVTSLWIQWHRWCDKEFDCIADAIFSKGPYIRVGPNEVIVNTVEAVQNVYGVGANNFDKHTYYDYFITQGSRNMFTSLGKDHKVRRRRIAQIYSRSYFQTSPHARAIMYSLLVERMLPVLSAVSSSDEPNANVLPLLQSFALDFMSTFAFGISRGFNFIRDEDSRRQWMNQFEMSYPGDSAFWMKEYPLLVKLLPALGIRMVPKGHVEARRACEEWSLAKVDECESAVQKAGGGLELDDSFAPGELPVLYSYVRRGLAQMAGAEKAFMPNWHEKLELASECFDHIAATGDTFGTMFTYMVYELSRHEKIQEQLREEFFDLEKPFVYNKDTETSMEIPSPTSLERLPFLDCVIKESLRLRNNSPNLDPRVTPAHGHSNVGALTDLPPGVRIGTYGWCLNRNPEVFPDPESWQPSRWQSGGPRDAALRNQWLFAFGGGSRGCIGQHVSMELMRLLLCGIYTNFRTTVADETEYPGSNRFVGSYCYERLFIRFERVDR